MPGADVGSVHDMVTMTFQTRLMGSRRLTETRIKFDFANLNNLNSSVMGTFQAPISGIRLLTMLFIHPYNPHLYRETGVYRVIHSFLIFALKHRLWVLVEAVLTCTHSQCFEQN